MRLPHLSLAAAALVAAAAITACGSSGASSTSNGVASKSPKQILSAANQAAQSAHSVHVSGSMVTGGQPLKLDLNLVNGKGASGTIATSGFSVNVIDVGNTVYLKGSDSFWRHFGGSGAAQLFKGKWLKAPSTGSFSSFAQFTNLSVLFSRLFASHGAVTKGAPTSFDGHKAVPLTDAAQGGTLYVATTGKPYPLGLTKKGSGGGTVRFTQYNQAFSIAAPKNAVDISKFQQ